MLFAKNEINMKALLIYAAPTDTGSSATVAKELDKQLDFKITHQNIIFNNDTSLVRQSKLIIFLVATYGDQELQGNTEEFIRSINFDLKEKQIVICELGNYYGYDDYSFGSGAILKNQLLKMNAIELCEGLSMDSLPQLDWIAFNKWITIINNKVN